MNTHSQEYPRTFAVLRSISKRLLLILLAVLMAGCGAEDLYTNVTESDANTMLGLLIARGISATKRPVKASRTTSRC